MISIPPKFYPQYRGNLPVVLLFKNNNIHCWDITAYLRIPVWGALQYYSLLNVNFLASEIFQPRALIRPLCICEGKIFEREADWKIS